ncbi:TPA: polysaccharide biosynthesis protein [Staphylococcus pseudintermedius]|uniref:putative polysaccharide biosynthesis protein n=1 Tax=Staphylococcus pseudintermedius TaxID=283734 RepID=UPI00129E8EB1|nr:polysaccharide biosynthesis protein [Staphylococcus pseudintermedius]EJQ7841240.1 polysaccharide biosynthesis protein [Staphylococcus pseudintermedius]EJY3772577.1 polysaccharide biosynthesis protein [Staphylococcus pseudintermedius]ELJ9222419.1 polysaccharide biosynthesis protein [Staphylococcus pseudintermedius]ELK4500861.1 polysaccharide biosynthesis protein [Staphylococcus pseudintermedius]ELP8732408.1 polysaccharide biosynthesis protein [Staphylococcus pseudintermedius]
MSENKELVRGTFLLTLSILITKVLGIIYVIPFYQIIGGADNLAPFNYAYGPYNVAIAVATAGVPLAASKYVAKYNTLGAYRVSQKLYKSSFIVMSITGILGFVILYLLSPMIASVTIAHNMDKNAGWTVDQITAIIRTISFVVIFIPVLATWRGVFQGYKSMGPTALSEVTEQIARIIFILVGSYLVLNVFDGSVLLANGIATFGAAIGAIAGILTLWWYWIKRRRGIHEMVASDMTGIDVSYSKMYKEILSYSIPFVIVSLNFPLFMIVDQLTHNNALSIAGVETSLQGTFFTMLNMTTNKIVMIPTSLAAGFAISLIPFITKTYEKGDYVEMHRQIRTSLGVLMYITVPASLGIMALAVPLYTVFYEYSMDGSRLLFYYAPVAILISLLSVTASMLQGIDKQKLTVFVIVGSVVLKFILNMPLIIMFETAGAILSTAIALTFAIVCNFFILKKYARFKFNETIIDVCKILLYSFMMMIIVEIIYFVFQFVISPASHVGAFIITVICAIVGVIIYAVLTMKTRLADKFLGEIPNKIRRKVSFL